MPDRRAPRFVSVTIAAPDAELRVALLEWGRYELRDLPWRQTRDPWTILVSETMLQQTQVSRVIDRLPRFLERFPSVTACAADAAGAVVEEWAGLGYNRRPLNLHRAATIMTAQHGGRVPERLEDLLALPGVGPYTARAVRAFAFEQPAAVVDTNIGRVLARLGGAQLSPKQAQARADNLAPSAEPWLWNQSIMELGALVCSKRTPRCDACPVFPWCTWRGVGDDPATGSAAVSVPQSRFEGSDRQLRGRLVDALRGGPVLVDDVGAIVGADDPDRIALVIDSLLRDGLALRDEGSLRLP